MIVAMLVQLQDSKVFCFFSSEKKVLLYLTVVTCSEFVLPA